MKREKKKKKLSKVVVGRKKRIRQTPESELASPAWRLLRVLGRADGVSVIVNSVRLLPGPVVKTAWKMEGQGMNISIAHRQREGCVIHWQGETYRGSDVADAADRLRHRLARLARRIARRIAA